MITLLQPATESQWNDYYALRYNVLRKPWNQEPGTEVDSSDHESYNLMARDERGIVCACGRLHWNSEQQAQVRYMAVHENYQHQGLGSLILTNLEQYAVSSKKETSNFILEAREHAIAFYEKHGYTVVKKSYLLFNSIQHYTMEKNLLR